MLLNAGELPIVPNAVTKWTSVSYGHGGGRDAHVLLAGLLAEKFSGGGMIGKKFRMDVPDERAVKGVAKSEELWPVKSPNGASPISTKFVAPSRAV